MMTYGVSQIFAQYCSSCQYFATKVFKYLFYAFPFFLGLVCLCSGWTSLSLSLSLLDFTFCGLNFLFRTGQADDVTGSGLLHSRGIFLVKLLGNEIMREY